MEAGDPPQSALLESVIVAEVHTLVFDLLSSNRGTSNGAWHQRTTRVGVGASRVELRVSMATSISLTPFEQMSSHHETREVVARTGDRPKTGGRPPSMDSAEYAYHSGSYSMKVSPPSSYGSSAYYRYAQSSPRVYHRNLQSVVTHSFSTEDREDLGSLSARQELYPEQRFRMNPSFERDMEPVRERRVISVRRELPLKGVKGHRTLPIQRAHSSGAEYFVRSPGKMMKRNYFHHARNGEGQAPLPDDFLPPKRLKVSSASKKEVHVSPRSHEPESPEYRSKLSWDVDPRSYGRTYSMPVSSPSWSPRSHRPIVLMEHESPRWSQSPSAAWHHHHIVTPRKAWMEQGRDEYDDPRGWVSSRDDYDVHHSYHAHPPRGMSTDRMHLVAQAAAATSQEEMQPPVDDSVTLLSLPMDKASLSETLCIVRENIEVFTATQADVDAPAPGRKHSVSVGQVGLRCIHCRHTVKNSDRVKRGVCYPSSIKRIYRTVIDMKLDHFALCKFVPQSLKDRLDELKSVHTRSTGTTMQYFIRAAHMLGMEDTASGVRLNTTKAAPPTPKPSETTNVPRVLSDDLTQPDAVERPDTSGAPVFAHQDDSHMGASAAVALTSIRSDSMSMDGSDMGVSATYSEDTGVYFNGNVSLALPEDKSALSPLRCFLREQVCAFSATEQDIAVRSPTTFSIVPGQVGIGCIHCVSSEARSRSNRSVCFPSSIGRIYQSVADIQRFHFGECQNMPDELRQKFIALHTASSKGSKGLATRQYWISSARKIGLVDTPNGIRFGRDPVKIEPSHSFSLDILAQAALSVTTVNKPLVLPEDKESIADFVYLVMEQLQACRFTEADRNKRRMKDVGCIGVECKHCAGQVDSRKFFWSSVNAVESNFVSVHTHMLECRMIPEELKEQISELKKLRKEQTAQHRAGSQKKFFARVWERLHDDDEPSERSVSDMMIEERAPTQVDSPVTHDASEQESRDDDDSMEHRDIPMATV